MFKKMILLFLAGCVLLVPVLAAAGSDIDELKSREEAAGGAGGAGERVDRILCVDGLKVFQTIVLGVGTGSGAGVSTIQLYEERDGKTVPATCTPKTEMKK